jgi:hypothetical protein
MFCEPYRQSLTEAACSGEMLPRELAAHLDGCSACSTAYAREQELFASIDHALHAAVNLDVAPSLVPRVRAQIETIPARSFWRLPSIAFATGCMALVIFGIAYSRVRHSVGDPSKISAIVVSPTNQSYVANQPGVLPPQVLQPEGTTALREQTTVRRVSLRSAPEVLISAEERAEFERYVTLAQARPLQKAVSASVKEDLGPEIKPLEIAELELEKLAIEPLKAGGSE